MGIFLKESEECERKRDIQLMLTERDEVFSITHPFGPISLSVTSIANE